MKPEIRRDKKRETLTLHFTEERVAVIDERLEPVIETWKKYGGLDLTELLRSCYFQGLMDGSSVEVTEQAAKMLVAA